MLRGSPNLPQLLGRQFSEQRVAQGTRLDDMLRILDRGMVDAIYGGAAINMEKIRRSGRDLADHQVGMTVETADIWLGDGRGFSEAERLAWRQAYDAWSAMVWWGVGAAPISSRRLDQRASAREESLPA